MRLIQIFKLENSKQLFQQAVNPKSAGGGDEFKLLALIGDKVFDLLLIDILTSNQKPTITDSGILTPLLDTMTDKMYFAQIARKLSLPDLMQAKDPNHNFSVKELCESIEALMGATYKVHGLSKCRQVIETLQQEYDFFTPDLDNILNDNFSFVEHNPKGRLLEFFQQQNLDIRPEELFNTNRIGGTDHLPEFQSIIEIDYDDQNYQVESKLFSSKKEAEKDVALKLLKLLIKN